MDTARGWKAPPLLVGLPHLSDGSVWVYLAGVNLGPVLWASGSLAGLLWLHSLRVRGVAIPLGLFVRVGLVVTIPSLLVSLAMLWLLTL